MAIQPDELNQSGLYLQTLAISVSEAYCVVVSPIFLLDEQVSNQAGT
jgi:hypothetical protein